MPDWSYRTVLRPLFFRLPPETARDVALMTIGAMGRSQLGAAVIDFLGDMRADSRLQTRHLGQVFPTFVGLGAGLDAIAVATRGLARFGLGFLELGPVTVEPIAAPGTTTRDLEREAITRPDPAPNPGLAALVRRFARDGRPARLPLLARLAVSPAATPDEATRDVRRMIAQLSPYIDVFVLDTPRVAAAAGWDDASIRATCKPPRWPSPSPGRRTVSSSAFRRNWTIRPVGDSSPWGGRRASWAWSWTVRCPAIPAVACWEPRRGRSSGMPCGGSAIRPAPSSSSSRAAASTSRPTPSSCSTAARPWSRLSRASSSAVRGSPSGSTTRCCSQATPSRRLRGKNADPTKRDEPPRAEQNWFWALLMGLGMLAGSVLAVAIAATHVVLAYDETFVGLSHAQLEAVNPRLLPFMAHDRISLAGTMMTIGILYTSLAAIGLRRGLRWAQVAVQLSAIAGFGSFFLFLGFGYFDPFHAFVTVVLFQFLLLMLHSRLAPPAPIPPPGLHNDRRWRLGLWGQLLHVAQASAFLAAGTTIALVGVTDVFVPEDLEFMQTTAEALRSASPRLVPLIAHDRASFGGMIVASGLCFLGVALWGFRRGARWVWWTLLLAGIPGYAFAIGVHFVVGYENLWHLTPAFAGLAVFIVAQVLSYPYLAAPDPALLDEWRERAGPDRATQPGQ